MVISPPDPSRETGKREPYGSFFQRFDLLPLSLQNLALEFVRPVLVLSLCPRGVIPDAAYPLKPLLVSSHESF
ncbi:MAG: hypothetical protein QOF62_2938 [Pyrinomonadaceae bacterium]|jgi:hypothetical protein|nr:hypothetical protein [Pyrinomonadaceae bacterium]